MTSNVPAEPDDFQTRMRSSAIPSTGGQPAPTSPFAPPGNDGGPQQPARPTEQFAAGQTSELPQPPQFGQASQAPQGYGAPSQQASFGQGSQAPTQPGMPQPSVPPQGAPQGVPQQGFPPAGYQQTGYQQAGGYGPVPPQGPGGWGPQPPRDANPLRAAFDFSFNAYATPGLVKIVYIIAVAVGALVFLGFVIAGFANDPRLGLVALVLGWIPLVLWILVVRVGLETSLANVRTATDVRVLRERSDADAAS